MAVQLLGRSEAGPQLNLPLYIEGQTADQADPDSFDEQQGVDLNGLCLRNPESTLFVAMDTAAMEHAGIHAGDVLIVDRSLKPEQGRIILASFQGDLMVRELTLRPTPRLVARHSEFEDIIIPEHAELVIYGVVTQAIHTLRNGF